MLHPPRLFQKRRDEEAGEGKEKGRGLKENRRRGDRKAMSEERDSEGKRMGRWRLKKGKEGKWKE